MQVAVIIPTYNEAENLAKLVSALFSLPLDLRVIIVDDNSPDGTGRIADELARSDQRLRVIHRPGKLGLRSAYISGIQDALQNGADAVAQTNAKCRLTNSPHANVIAEGFAQSRTHLKRKKSSIIHLSGYDRSLS